MINISDKRSTDKLIADVLGRALGERTDYPQVYPTEIYFLSEEDNDRAVEKGLIKAEFFLTRNEKPLKLSLTQKRELKELLVHDPISFTCELLAQHISLLYPDAVFNPESLEIKDMDYKGTFIEKLLNSLKESKEKYEKNGAEEFENLKFTPCFFVKDLIYSDLEFMDMRTQAGIIKRQPRWYFANPENRLDFETVEDVIESNQAFLNMEIQEFEEALSSELFEKLINKAFAMAKRYQTLKVYEPQLIKAFNYDIKKSKMLKLLVVNATEEEFDLLHAFLCTLKPLTPPSNFKYPGEITIRQCLYPNSKFKFFGVSNKDDKSLIVRAGSFLVGEHGEERPIAHLPYAIRMINACSEIIDQNGGEPVIVNLPTLWHFMCLKGNPNKKQTQEVIATFNYLRHTEFYRAIELIDETGKHKLNPESPEEQEFFNNYANYTFSPTITRIAVETDPVINVSRIGMRKNKNDTETFTFKLWEKPIMNRVSEDTKQIYFLSYQALCTGNAVKSPLADSILLKLTSQIKWENCTNWIRSYKKFFADFKEDLDNPAIKRNLLEILESVLNHLKEKGLILSFNIERKTGNFFFVPQQLEEPERFNKLKGDELKKAKKSFDRLNRLRRLSVIKKQFKEMLRKAPNTVFTQRVSDLKCALEVYDHDNTGKMKPRKKAGNHTYIINGKIVFD